MNKTSVLLTAAVLAGPAFAQGGDDCTMPTAINAFGTYSLDTTAATTSGFAGSGGACDAAINQDLFWVYTAPSAGDLQFDTIGSSYDTKISVFAGGDCTSTCIATNDDGGGNLTSLVTILGVNVGDVLLVQVGGFGTSFGTGQLNIADAPAQPDCTMPDSLEVNFDCASATPLVDGTYTDLNIETADNDYYAVTVLAGGSLQADIFFSNSFGDVDIYLWDPAVECDTNVAGTGGAYLVRGFSASDNETITYDNLTGADQNLIIEIDMFSAANCNAYDMTIVGTGVGDGGIGTAYCMANPNSTGSPSSILVSGSNTVANNDVTLTASGLPNNAFGFFITSLASGFVANPAGSAGNLCLGGAIGRYVGPGQIMSSGATDTIELAIDLTMIPSPSGFVSAAPGDVWFYQLWHRDTDMGVATSNFTDGYEVTYN